MTSLSVIMDMNEDEQDARAIKKDGTSQGGRRYTAAPSSSANAAQPGLAAPDQSSASKRKPSSSSSSSKKSSSAAAPQQLPPQPYSSSSPALPSQSAAAPGPYPSEDPMDHHAYGHSGTSSSTTAAMRMRPVSNKADADIPVKLTPITGRVSRAKKGMPVHVCESCKPPKTFTRAEHLRRHKLSHEKPQYPCKYPGCEKAFHRPDLLQRHQQRHETEGDRASGTNTPSRRVSHSSSTSQPATSPYATDGYQAGTSKSPSAQPISPPVQSPGFPSALKPPTTYGQTQTQYAPSQPASMPGYSQGMYAPTINAPAVTEASYGTIPTAGVLAPPATRQGGGWSMAYGQATPMYQSAPAYGYPNDMSYSSYSSAGLGPEPGMGEGYDFQGMAEPIVVSPPPISSSTNSLLSGYPNTPGQPLSSPSPNRLVPEPAFGAWSNSSTPSMSSATLSVGTAPFAHGDLLFPNAMDINTDGLDVAMLMAPQMVPNLAGMAAGPCVRPRGVQQPSMPNLDEYLEVYFSKVSPKLPVIHVSLMAPQGETVVEDFGEPCNLMGPMKASRTLVLQAAMAAIASQFMPSRETRIQGNRMHQWASSEVKTSLELSNIQVMQTIVLCEYYARFRGPKAAVRSSNEFGWVYKQLLADRHMLQPHQITTFADWINLETRRRLLSACFLLDIHASTLQSQETLTSRVLNDPPGQPLPIPLTRRTTRLWEECPDEASWKALLDSDSKLRNAVEADPEVVPSVRSIDSSRAAEIARTPFDGCLIGAAEALLLCPEPNSPSSMEAPQWNNPFGGTDGGISGTSEGGKLSSSASSVSLCSTASQTTLCSDDEPDDDLEAPTDPDELARDVEEMDQFAARAGEHLLFPKNTTSLAYAALRATPLHALLAVSGDTFLFAHKTSNLRAFAAHQRRLRAWAGSSQACGTAARWAARALLGLLVEGGDPRQESWTQEISGYWTVYVCVLILWAFGHRGAPPSASAGRVDDEGLVFGWLRSVGEMERGDNADRLRHRALSEGLVRVARRRLQGEASSGPNKLLTDAIRVLGKLEEKGDKVWF